MRHLGQAGRETSRSLTGTPTQSSFLRSHPQSGWSSTPTEANTLVKVSKLENQEKQKANNKTIFFYITIQFNLLHPLTCLRDLHGSLPRGQAPCRAPPRHPSVERHPQPSNDPARLQDSARFVIHRRLKYVKAIRASLHLKVSSSARHINSNRPASITRGVSEANDAAVLASS